MAEGNGNGNGKGPWWTELLRTIGPTAAIAIYLVYALSVTLGGKIEQNSEDIKETGRQVRQMLSALDMHMKMTTRVENSLDVQSAVAVQQCINSAEARNDHVARDRCWMAWKDAKPNDDTTDPALNGGVGSR